MGDTCITNILTPPRRPTSPNDPYGQIRGHPLPNHLIRLSSSTSTTPLSSNLVIPVIIDLSLLIQPLHSSSMLLDQLICLQLLRRLPSNGHKARGRSSRTHRLLHPPDTQQYNTVPPPPARPPSNEHQQRVWSQPSYAPPPPPPPLGYSPPPPRVRDRTSPNSGFTHLRRFLRQIRLIAVKATAMVIATRRRCTRPTASRSHNRTTRTHMQVHLMPTAVPEPAPEPVAYTSYSPPTTNPIDFNKLVSSYHMILEAGKTLAAPRAPLGAVDRMLENAFYAAQVLDGASSGSSHGGQHQSRSLPTVVRTTPVTVQQTSSAQQHPPHSQLQRIHSAPTVSPGSDAGRTPSYPQPPPTRSPPGPSTSSTNARVKDISPREGKAKIKINSPANGKGTLGLHGHPHAAGSDGAPVVVSSPSRPKSQKLEDSGHAPAVGDSSGAGRAQDHGGGTTQKCLGCGATATPEWRRGPLGPRTLCNACGLVYAKLVKKRMREDARSSGSSRAANGYGSRSGQNVRGGVPGSRKRRGRRGADVRPHTYAGEVMGRTLRRFHG
ncbi:GATA-type domain-containing protein [Mycena venus]|uniref:GATA-type domain-containing protein n=1 Tax=Mycena venus TaxID=2733690 RepID=A0A8H6XS61_9AGAR|nr:GATA-type domain-containing protein [Mycena venus]